MACHGACLMTVGVLFCLLNTGTEALKQGKSFPYPYDWDRFPAAWFGGNSTDWESPDQLAEIGKYSMAILGWQHLITGTNWTASIYAQLNQAAIIKSHHPDLPVYVYTGFGNADGYNAATWEVMSPAFEGCRNNQPCNKDWAQSDWFLQSTQSPVYSMSGCEQMGLGYSDPPTPKCANLIWNTANDSAIDYYIDHIIAPLAAAPMIDGVFFDCFNYAYDIPAVTPWGRQTVNVPGCNKTGGAGCEALLAGTVEMATRTAKLLNSHGKVPMFANPASYQNKPHQAIWLNETRLIDALNGTTYSFYYEFMRAELMESSNQLFNMLQEGQAGVAAGAHVYYQQKDPSCKPSNATTCPLEDDLPHLAAFLITREEYWYYFGSTGWLDKDFKWSKNYDTLAKCGKPKGAAFSEKNGSVWRRDFEGCSAELDCSLQTPCKGQKAGPCCKAAVTVAAVTEAL